MSAPIPTPPSGPTPTGRTRLSGKLRKLFVGIRQALTKTDAQIPYSAVFTASGTTSFPPDFSAADFPGLLFCHIVRGNASDHVITYWRDEAHFKALSPAFLSRVALTGPSGSGFVVDLRQQRVPLS